MSQPTAGSMLANMLKAQEKGASPEELNRMGEDLRQQITRQLEDAKTKVTVSITTNFIRD